MARKRARSGSLVKIPTFLLRSATKSGIVVLAKDEAWVLPFLVNHYFISVCEVGVTNMTLECYLIALCLRFLTIMIHQGVVMDEPAHIPMLAFS